MDYSEKKISENLIYQGHIIRVHVDSVELTDGQVASREIVDHAGGVAILPIDNDGNVRCVRQYRYARAEHILEIPAGKLDEGESPLHCAMRELHEETGLTADSYVDLGAFYPSPGYCDETLYCYLATGLHEGEQKLDEGEFLDVLKIPFSELLRMTLNNELCDAKTIIAVMKTALLDKTGALNHD